MRKCAQCRAPLHPLKRSDARFCSPRCRYRSWAGEAPTTPTNASRRPSRNGRGIRIYFTPEDLRDREAVRQKVLTARRRIK